MKWTINTLAPLASAFLFATGTAAACHADNCYRALFPCASPAALSSAVDFCRTLTISPTLPTATPTRATAACGTGTSAYRSACACGPTCTPTPSCTATPGILPNGDFECGIAPWTPQVPDSAATWKLSSPGNTGNVAFEADLLSVPVSPDMGVNVRVTSPTLAVTVGAAYQLNFASWFDDLQSGFIGVLVNGNPIYTIDATDRGAGVWYMNSIAYTPTTATITIRFEFLFGTQHVPSVQKIDSVVFGLV